MKAPEEVSNSFGQTLRVGDAVYFAGDKKREASIIRSIQLPEDGDVSHLRNHDSHTYNRTLCVLSNGKTAHPSVLRLVS